jgi:glycosyltransferase involved in cell wall biosynthesis
MANPISRSLKEVTVFATGDPNEPSTWSNIPYFLVEALRRKQVQVHTVNLEMSKPLKLAYDASFRLPLKLLAPKSEYAYFRCPVNQWDVDRRIKAALRRYPNSQLNLFLTFSFTAAPFTATPSVQICDWPFEYRIGHFGKRKPDLLERETIRRERRCMESSSLVVSLFPGVAKHLATEYPKATTVIDEPEQLVSAKVNSSDILFIGAPHYRGGLERLVEAFRVLKMASPELRLHVVGMTEQQLGMTEAGMTCYGYLDKGIPEQRATYEALLKKARVIVNPTPKWGGFSSLVEAMYFGTPVVTTPYGEFVESFGDQLDFGAYCQDTGLESLCHAIQQATEPSGYSERCNCAHNAAKGHTWDAFVQRLLAELGFLPGSI